MPNKKPEKQQKEQLITVGTKSYPGKTHPTRSKTKTRGGSLKKRHLMMISCDLLNTEVIEKIK